MVGDTATADRGLVRGLRRSKTTAHKIRTNPGKPARLACNHCSSTRFGTPLRNGGDQRFLVLVGHANPAASDHASSAGISRSAHRRLVAATLDSISPSEQRLIEFSYFSRMTTSAIASKMRVSDSAVRSGLEAAITRLHKLFQSQDFRAGREAGVSKHERLLSRL